MHRLKLKHWQDVVSVLVGVWLIASPWLLGIHGHVAAIGNFVFLGACLIGFALTEMFLPESWEEWSELVIGLWLLGSPWILEFKDVQPAFQNAIGCGILVTVLAIWVLGTDRDLGGWFRGRQPS